MRLKKQQIAKYIDDKLERPSSLRRLMQLLAIDKRDRVQFRNVLKQLVREGRLVRIRGNRYASSSKLDLVVGRYHAHKNGSYAFVIPDDPNSQDVYVLAKDSMGALPEDRVVVRVEGYRPGAGPRGKVIRILEENLNSLVGKLDQKPGYAIVHPFDRRVAQDVYIPPDQTLAASNGVYVQVSIDSRPAVGSMMVGSVVKIIGFGDEPWIDRKVIESQYGLTDEFDRKTIKELESLPENITEDQLEGRIDFRGQNAVTIDGEDAQDFDDAVFLEPAPDEGYHLYIHIADVATYVIEESSIDKEASKRGTSVYFTEKAIPMLPPKLSNGICSLKPCEDRLTLTCKMTIDRSGKIQHAEVQNSIIRSKARLTYTQVYDIISNPDSDPSNAIDSEIRKMLIEMHNLSKKMRDLRLHKGFIDFDFPEVEFSLSESGEVTSIFKREINDAHRIIEEFMIAANETIASLLILKRGTGLFRIHEGPDPLKVKNFLEVYRGLGYEHSFPLDSPTPLEFAKMLHKARNSVYEQMLGRLMLRSLKLARYTAKNVGHFGLASEAYTHFTSPIRRYPDLAVHRLVKEIIGDGATRFSPGEIAAVLNSEDAETDSLNTLASRCSTLERNAEAAEKELILWRQIRFMDSISNTVFTAVITDITSYGIHIELRDYFFEGLIHISSIYDDFYHFDPKRRTFTGEGTGKSYRIGQEIRVVIASIDHEKRQIDFGPHGIKIRRRKRSPRSRPSR